LRNNILKIIKANYFLYRSLKFIYDLRVGLINLLNKIFGYKYLDLGSGAGRTELRWRNFDVQDDGEIIDENTTIDLKDNSIDYAHCSHFFEHISDKVAFNMLKEVNRVLKPGGTFRVTVPIQQFFINAYKNADKDYLKNMITNDNLNTWHIYGVDTESLEQLLIGVIGGIHNKNHRVTRWGFEENLNCEIPVVTYPFQDRLEGFYCGPVTNMSDDLIRKKLSELSTNDFVTWVLHESNSSPITKNIFPSWHKNDWSMERLEKYANIYGFSACYKSEYRALNFKMLSKRNREPLAKSSFSLYLNLVK